MSEQEARLRAAFTMLAAPVVPDPDPLARLLARRRRRRRLRLGGLVAAVVALVAGGTLVPVVAQGPAPRPVPTIEVDPSPFPPRPLAAELNAWSRRLIDGPVRGNLAGDPAYVAELTGMLSRPGWEPHLDPDLTGVKVLVVSDNGTERVFLAAFYNATRAMYHIGSAASGASLSDLVMGASQTGPLHPFGLDLSARGSAGASVQHTFAFAPPGCDIATGRPGGPWQSMGDLVFRSGRLSAAWWRVTCDGVVRELRHPGWTGGPAASAADRDFVPPRGTGPTERILRAMAGWRYATGLPDGHPRPLWAGRVPGTTTDAAVVTGTGVDGSLRVVALVGPPARPDNYVPVVTARRGGGLDRYPTGGPVLTTAVAATADLVAVRLAEPPYSALGDRVLVVAPPGAATLRTDRGVTTTLADGVGVLTVPFPAAVTLIALDPAGGEIARLRFTEPDADGALFGDPLFDRWS